MIELQAIGWDKVRNILVKLSPSKSRVLYNKALDTIAFQMQTFIKRDELSGQVLKAPTGRLRNSVVVLKTESGGLPARIIRAGGGAKDVKYAAIHEHGGTITAKNAPYLVFKIHTSTRVFSKKFVKLKNPVAGFSWIRVKSVKIPKRPFMQPAADKFRPMIPAIIKRVVEAGVHANA